MWLFKWTLLNNTFQCGAVYYVVWGGSNFWVCGWNLEALPFNWKHSTSNFIGHSVVFVLFSKSNNLTHMLFDFCLYYSEITPNQEKKAFSGRFSKPGSDLLKKRFSWKCSTLPLPCLVWIHRLDHSLSHLSVTPSAPHSDPPSGRPSNHPPCQKRWPPRVMGIPFGEDPAVYSRLACHPRKGTTM